MAAKRGGQRWTRTEENALVDLAARNTPTRVIGIKLDRSEDSVRSKANELEVSLKPTNQRPYGPQKK